MSQGLLIIRSHLQRGVSRSHDFEKMFQVFQTLAFARYNSTEAFASGSSASLHSDVTVRFFESDTRVIECAAFRVHSTWVSGISTRLHADFTTIVMLGVTVRLVSKFLTSEVDWSPVRSARNSLLRDWTSRFMVEYVMALISQLFLTRIDKKSRLPQR